eukprot:944116_1
MHMNLNRQSGTWRSEIRHYEIGELLGKGAFSYVNKATHKPDRKSVAIKIIDKNQMRAQGLLSRIISEVEIHSQLRHPHIAELYHCFEDEESVYLVVEYCERGEMTHLMRRHGRLSEPKTRAYMQQLVKGLMYLHSHRIVHRDLKIPNLLLTKDGTIKICDFGLAVQLSSQDEQRNTICGTPNYISPEIVSHQPHGRQCDLWSLGCLLFTFLTGRPPFESTRVEKTLSRVVRLDFEFPEYLSHSAKDLIMRLLQKHPDERLDLTAVMAHDFLSPDPVQQPSSTKRPPSRAGSEVSRTNSVGSGAVRTNGSSGSGRSSRGPGIHPKPTRAGTSLYASPPKPRVVTLGNTTMLKLMSPGRKTSDFRSSLKPFNTVRIPPISHETKYGVVSIESSGEVCLESKDSKVSFYTFQCMRDVRVTDYADPRSTTPSSTFMCRLRQLPSDYQKKYNFCKRFVDLVRSKTPKIIVYSSHSKCTFYRPSKSSMIEFVFHNNDKVKLDYEEYVISVQSPASTRRCYRIGSVNQSFNHGNHASSATSTQSGQLNHANSSQIISVVSGSLRASQSYVHSRAPLMRCELHHCTVVGADNAHGIPKPAPPPTSRNSSSNNNISGNSTSANPTATNSTSGNPTSSNNSSSHTINSSGKSSNRSYSLSSANSSRTSLRSRRSSNLRRSNCSMECDLTIVQKMRHFCQMITECMMTSTEGLPNEDFPLVFDFVVSQHSSVSSGSSFGLVPRSEAMELSSDSGVSSSFMSSAMSPSDGSLFSNSSRTTCSNTSTSSTATQTEDSGLVTLSDSSHSHSPHYKISPHAHSHAHLRVSHSNSGASYAHGLSGIGTAMLNGSRALATARMGSPRTPDHIPAGGVAQSCRKYHTRHRAPIRNMRCRRTLSATFLSATGQDSGYSKAGPRAMSVNSSVSSSTADQNGGTQPFNCVLPPMSAKRLPCDPDITFHSSPAESPAKAARAAQSLSVDSGDVVPGSNWGYSQGLSCAGLSSPSEILTTTAPSLRSNSSMTSMSSIYRKRPGSCQQRHYKSSHPRAPPGCKLNPIPENSNTSMSNTSMVSVTPSTASSAPSERSYNSVHIAGVGWAFRSAGGNISVHFEDGEQVVLPSGTNTMVHIDKRGQPIRFNPASGITNNLKEKLVHVEVFIDRLLDVRVNPI